MRLNKYIQALLLFVIIVINETAPFLYNDEYTMKDMKWGWIISFPLLLLIANSFINNKEKD